MAAADGIRIDGLREFQSALGAMGSAADDKLDEVGDAAAQLVAARARRKMPTKTGAARGSVRVADGVVVSGGRRAPYAGWLDFGGRVGPKRSVVRPYRREGRYVYAALFAEEAEVSQLLERALVDLASDAGLEVT